MHLFLQIKNKIPKTTHNLAKLGDGLDESPTVMVGDQKNEKNGRK